MSRIFIPESQTKVDVCVEETGCCESIRFKEYDNFDVQSGAVSGPVTRQDGVSGCSSVKVDNVSVTNSTDSLVLVTPISS